MGRLLGRWRTGGVLLVLLQAASEEQGKEEGSVTVGEVAWQVAH